MRCAAVIPCFNESRTIAPLVETLRRYLPCVIVIDDGSHDDTAGRARGAGAIVLRHERNGGKGTALRVGLSRAQVLGFEWALTMDGDGQHDPADVPTLLQCAEKTGTPLVIGNRMSQAQSMPWLRRQVNRWMSRKLSKYAGCPLPDTQCGFRLIHLPTCATVRLSARHFEIESEMLMVFLAAQHRVEFVPINVINGQRKSRIYPIRDSLRWWKWWKKMKHDAQSSIGVIDRHSSDTADLYSSSPSS